MGLLTAAAIGCMKDAKPGNAEPTGASAAWTSADASVVRARALIERGAFAEAERMLGEAAGGDRRAQQEMLEIIRRVRWEYGLDDAALLEKVRKAVPDATAVTSPDGDTDATALLLLDHEIARPVSTEPSVALVVALIWRVATLATLYLNLECANRYRRVFS